MSRLKFGRATTDLAAKSAMKRLNVLTLVIDIQYEVEK
jgi:hypothetical protein